MKQFFPQFFDDAAQHKGFIDNLVTELTHEEEVENPDTQEKTVVREDVKSAKVRVAVALGLAPLHVLPVLEEIRAVDIAAIRLRSRFCKEDAEENLKIFAEQIDHRNQYVANARIAYSALGLPATVAAAVAVGDSQFIPDPNNRPPVVFPEFIDPESLSGEPGGIINLPDGVDPSDIAPATVADAIDAVKGSESVEDVGANNNPDVGEGVSPNPTAEAIASFEKAEFPVPDQKQ